MKRKPIIIEEGGILPVRRGLWDTAAEKLHEAKEAICRMKVAKDRSSYEACWTNFVDSLEEFWTRFYGEGKTTFSNFQPWIGRIEKKRKKDKILQYLRQSRHQSQHGRIAMNWTEGKLHIAPNFSGHVYSYAVFADGTNTIRAVPDHPSVGEAEIVLSPGDPTLPVIENKKYGQTYPPPTEFNGTEHTVKSPIQVATNGIKFYENVLQKALDKFQPSIKKGA